MKLLSGLDSTAVSPGETAGDGEAWPGVADPAGLLSGITEWLTGYGNHQTRRTYAEGLGLPVTAADIGAWLRPRTGAHDQWAEAVADYAQAVIIPPAAKSAGRTGPPPASRGRLRACHWLRWCAANGVDPSVATSAQVKTWLRDLESAGAAPSTRDRMLATVKTMYSSLADTGLVAANPAALDRRRLGLTAAAASTSATITLTTRQVAALHQAAGTPRRGASACDVARSVAIVALFTLGLRVSELCGLDGADLHVTRGRRALRVHGKGGKVRIVYLSVPAERALMDYLALRTDGTGTEVVTGAGRRTRNSDLPLLVTRGGRRFSRQAIWQLLRRIAAAGGPDLADVAEAMHPHALRHFYVTAAVEAGASLEHVQADVGHASIDTTSGVYDHAARDPARSAVDLVADAWHVDGA
ncbi:tyrosine-type recombinase/integrase [Amycolatopsis keratiniphila]|uniref:tyrosine-type recombinase/integrase n=1 Tax=Amycolatopsis keratiniphila TaxID=129921 RepID=UPI00087B5B6D|nr:tyrosine-type recombinase/integrase [Amycolatopsis keratiniphila]OLZ61556.1 integrase [Amycolatopsis keratiniphila subsp. nogabecina]SDU18691.1 Site-specific recombinase XerD [Amycolatopsis keratiniphila]